MVTFRSAVAELLSWRHLLVAQTPEVPIQFFVFFCNADLSGKRPLLCNPKKNY